MDAAVRELIEALHALPVRCVLSLTGGGATAAGLLLTVPGGSRSILEVVIPYSGQALTEFLGRAPAQACSPEASRAMALCALARARWLAPGDPVLGLGATAGLATDRPKHGNHRFHVTVNHEGRETTYSLTMTKNARSREEEEELLNRVILNALAESTGLEARLTLPLLEGEQIDVSSHRQETLWRRFLSGEMPLVQIRPDGNMTELPPASRAILSGAFNPAHEGHWRMMEAATRLTEIPSAFELSIINVDKPPLAEEEVRRRLHQFAWKGILLLTRAPTFAEKARLLPRSTFVVGVDTAARIVQPRYYEESEEKMIERLSFIRSQGCRFLVAGRIDATGRFARLADLAVPAHFLDIFTEIPEEQCRTDVSSTSLRSEMTSAASRFPAR